MEPISSLQAEEARLRSKLANNPFFLQCKQPLPVSSLDAYFNPDRTRCRICQHYI